MIQSRPQTNTLVSFSFFLLITLLVLVMNIIAMRNNPVWYTYLIIALLVPIGSFVAYRIFIKYKVVSMGNNQIEINYPVLRSKYQYPLSDITAWREHNVKTGKASTYKELEILFSDKRKLTMGHKEHTEYTRMVSYLSQKVPKKKMA